MKLIDLTNSFLRNISSPLQLMAVLMFPEDLNRINHCLIEWLHKLISKIYKETICFSVPFICILCFICFFSQLACCLSWITLCQNSFYNLLRSEPCWKPRSDYSILLSIQTNMHSLIVSFKMCFWNLSSVDHLYSSKMFSFYLVPLSFAFLWVLFTDLSVISNVLSSFFFHRCLIH